MWTSSHFSRLSRKFIFLELTRINKSVPGQAETMTENGYQVVEREMTKKSTTKFAALRAFHKKEYNVLFYGQFISFTFCYSRVDEYKVDMSQAGNNI